MGRIVVTEFVSLDGVMEEPHWTFDYQSEVCMRFKHDELFEAAALLLARKTYEGFAAAWPSLGHDDFGQRMNTIPKYVVSSTLSDEVAQWGPTTVLRGSLEEEVPRLRDQVDGTLLVEGSSSLVHGLVLADLVDAFRLMVGPLVLGAGLRVFPEKMPEPNRLQLVESRATDTGVLLVRYERPR